MFLFIFHYYYLIHSKSNGLDSTVIPVPWGWSMITSYSILPPMYPAISAFFNTSKASAQALDSAVNYSTKSSYNSVIWSKLAFSSSKSCSYPDKSIQINNKINKQIIIIMEKSVFLPLFLYSKNSLLSSMDYLVYSNYSDFSVNSMLILLISDSLLATSASKEA